jgi:hypothetical protein
MNKILIIMILAMFAFSCGGSSGGGAGAVDNTGVIISGDNGGNIVHDLNAGDAEVILSDTVSGISGETGDNTAVLKPAPVDSVNDVVRDSDETVSDIEAVDFEITVVNMNGEPLSGAIVTLKDENNLMVTSAVSNESGLVLFTSPIETDDTIAAISIIHPEYEAREISVEGIGSLEAVIRTVGLETAQETVAWTDTDGDGIPDEADAFPDDSELAFVSKGRFTLKFTETGFAVKLHITEKLNVKNEVVEIILHSIPVETGEAGYLFGVSIKGESWMLIRDLKTGSTKPVMINVKLSTPVPRTEMPAMPYEPFVKPAVSL